MFFFLLLCHNIACLKLHLCFNLITAPPSAQPPPILLAGLSSCGTMMPLSFITHPPPPLLSLSSFFPPPFLLCMFMLMMCHNTAACLSSSPVESYISALSPLQRHETQFESIKNSGLFGLVSLINID